ncbi:hypothetical protein IFM89_017351 [Coptis chinensis]|uniref:Uncharacterized protein n=1 Tax=Coptis chinensis TaxID=261450 RepID=A0A835LMK3_9MAGN|nr:hypothetical protein IFM89_017351 [Coptis chinensis]
MKVFGPFEVVHRACSLLSSCKTMSWVVLNCWFLLCKTMELYRAMGRYASLEYGHYGNPTTEFQEKKIRWLHRDGLKGNAKIVGVGFKARAESEGRLLYLKLGYNHEVELSVPPIRVFCFKPNIVLSRPTDKREGAPVCCYSFHGCKPPEVYKGKRVALLEDGLCFVYVTCCSVLF